jgi:hypothetical protein
MLDSDGPVFIDWSDVVRELLPIVEALAVHPTWGSEAGLMHEIDARYELIARAREALARVSSL